MFQIIGHPAVEKLYLLHDDSCALHGYIAIHSTRLGPAIGGTRCVPYSSEMEAIGDAIRLSRGMTYKSAIAGVDYGGGKAVLMAPAHIDDREYYFRKFGEYLEQLGGRYITSVDSGTEPQDMEYIAQATQYVTHTNRNEGDPSPYTALGVLHGIKSALKVVDGDESLSGVRVVVQGVGHVGQALARLLAREGAVAVLVDKDSQRAASLAAELGCQATELDRLYDVPCDVFSPCALGGVLNRHSISRLKCHIVAGSANNQLYDEADASLLADRQITYVPDFVINAGGLIYVALLGENAPENVLQQRIEGIGSTVTSILMAAREQGLEPNAVATAQAEAVLAGHDDWRRNETA